MTSPPLKPNAYKALLFDMDDTLYPERDYVLSGFDAVAHWAQNTLNIPQAQTQRHLRRLFATGVRGDTFNRWLALAGLHHHAPELIPQLVNVYRRHQPQLTPFPEAASALQQYHRHYQIALISDGYLEVQQRKFKALRLAHYFDAVIFSDTWGREAWKPSTHPFREALRQLQVSPTQALYIGDNPRKDFLGPRRLGMRSIWVRLPGGEYTSEQPPSTDHEPDAIAHSWQELDQLIRTTPN